MKITASGGTDGASIVLFWPDNLPEDADKVLNDDPIALVESMRDQGKLIWFHCDGDGGYSVAIFVRSDVPAELMANCGDQQTIPNLVVRGVGYFGGMEYMFKRDATFREEHPNMCAPVSIPDGTYSARVYRTTISDAVYDEWLLKHAGAEAKTYHDIHKFIAIGAVAGVLATLGTFCYVDEYIWYGIASITFVFFAIAVWMPRSERYKRFARARDEFEKEYPAYVVHLT